MKPIPNAAESNLLEDTGTKWLWSRSHPHRLLIFHASLFWFNNHKHLPVSKANSESKHHTENHKRSRSQINAQYKKY